MESKMMPRISVLLRDSQTIKLFACQLYRSCSNHALFSSDMAAATHAANKLMMKQTRQKLPKLQGKLLIVEGNIAAGKSTFSQRLGKHFDYVVHDEPAPKNPYLAKFYKEPKKYALKLQLWLFQQRFLMYVQGLKHIMNTGQGVILDRSVYSDLIFTNVVYKEGSISDKGYQYYLRLRQEAMRSLQAPYAAIHLCTPPEICYQRIVKRGREYEQQIPLTYLESLDAEHHDVFQGLSETGACPVLTYDWSEFGRDLNSEKVLVDSNGEMQFYASGFNKIVSDIREIETEWKPNIPDEFLASDSELEVLNMILSVEGYRNIAHEIPE